MHRKPERRRKLGQEIIDDVAVFFGLIAVVAGGDDVALGGVPALTEGDDVIHRYLLRQ